MLPVSSLPTNSSIPRTPFLECIQEAKQKLLDELQKESFPIICKAQNESINNIYNNWFHSRQQNQQNIREITNIVLANFKNITANAKDSPNENNRDDDVRVLQLASDTSKFLDITNQDEEKHALKLIEFIYTCKMLPVRVFTEHMAALHKAEKEELNLLQLRSASQERKIPINLVDINASAHTLDTLDKMKNILNVEREQAEEAINRISNQSQAELEVDNEKLEDVSRTLVNASRPS